MAAPRVFISSTFYDLRQVREDLEREIRELGYEPIRHETGRIPYSKDEKLESSAYREVELSDIIVSVVGGRFGTESADNPGLSISQAEIRRALDHGIQLFVFVEKSTLAEFSTYKLNKTTPGIKYRYADDVRVFEWIEVLYGLPQNNPIHGFETSADITQFLKKQWAGLFQRFLQDQRRAVQMRIIEEMNTTAKTLRELVTFLTEERKGTSDAINGILIVNHPAFLRFSQLVEAKYRVFFTTHDELSRWLAERGWTPVHGKDRDDDSVYEWVSAKKKQFIKLTHDIFDADGRLRVITAEDWDDDWVQLSAIQSDLTPSSDDDDVPF